MISVPSAKARPEKFAKYFPEHSREDFFASCLEVLGKVDVFVLRKDRFVDDLAVNPLEQTVVIGRGRERRWFLCEHLS